MNINSLRNKLELLSDHVKANVVILVVLERKLDGWFPVGQFKIPGYAYPFRIYRNTFGGGIIVFVREDIPSKLLSIEELQIEEVYIDLNLLYCSYNSNKNIFSKHLDVLI